MVPEQFQQSEQEHRQRCKMYRKCPKTDSRGAAGDDSGTQCVESLLRPPEQSEQPEQFLVTPLYRPTGGYRLDCLCAVRTEH